MILLFLILAQAPSFSLKDLDRNEVVLDSLLNKGPVVVEFWATWCKACVKQMDAFNKIIERFEGVTFIGITEDGPRTQRKVSLMVKSRKWKQLILYDNNQKVMKLFQVKAIPQTFIIGKNKKILYRHIGYKKKDVELFVKKLSSIFEESKESEEFNKSQKSD